MGDSARRKAALAVSATAGECLGIGLGDMSRLKLRKRQRAQQRREVLAGKLGVALKRSRRYLALHVFDPAIKKGS